MVPHCNHPRLEHNSAVTHCYFRPTGTQLTQGSRPCIDSSPHLVISTMRPKAVSGARHAAPNTAAAPTTTRVVGSATPHLRHGGIAQEGEPNRPQHSNQTQPPLPLPTALWAHTAHVEMQLWGAPAEFIFHLKNVSQSCILNSCMPIICGA